MNFEAAKNAALESASLNLGGIPRGPSDKLLDDEFLETDNCWVFFQHREIFVPAERALSVFAYAISKWNEDGRCIPDLRNNPVEQAQLVERLSAHFAKARPPAEQAKNE
jgi:hypothetical protein